MPASAIADLANDPSVVHISVDHKLGAKLDYTAAAINAPTAWQSGWTGTGVGVAISNSSGSPVNVSGQIWLHRLPCSG
jgi:hypothetical protein